MDRSWEAIGCRKMKRPIWSAYTAAGLESSESCKQKPTSMCFSNGSRCSRSSHLPTLLSMRSESVIDAAPVGQIASTIRSPETASKSWRSSASKIWMSGSEAQPSSDSFPTSVLLCCTLSGKLSNERRFQAIKSMRYMLRQAFNQLVAGSSPARPTIQSPKKAKAQVASRH